MEDFIKGLELAFADGLLTKEQVKFALLEYIKNVYSIVFPVVANEK